MKIMKTLKNITLAALAICLSLTVVRAANIFKADVGDTMDLATSWSNSVAPTSSDIATWDSTIVINSDTNVLGANLSWAGIKILDPASTIVISTNSSGNTLTLGASGIDLSAATQNLTLLNAVALGASQTWNVGSGRTLTLGGGAIISGTGALSKSGAGTLVISSTNSYSGGTFVNDGVIQVGSGTALGPAAGAITNNNGVTFRLRTTTSMANPVTFNGTVTLDLANVVGNAALVGSWSGAGTVNIINQDNGVGTVTNRVFTACGGSGGNMANFTGKVSFGTNCGVLRFNDGGSSPNTGNSSASFDLGTGRGSFLTRNRNASVSFGELTGGPLTRITQGSSASGTSIYSIGGLNTSTTFAGSIVDGGTSAAGFVSVNKVGSGTLTLTGTNTFAGATTVTLGTLQIGDGGTSGQLGLAAINNSATLVYNRSDAITVSNAISGTGTVIKTNSNTVTFNGANTSSGTLAVNGGTAAVGPSGSITCPISLMSGTFFDVSLNPAFSLGQILSGSGSVTGLLVAASSTASIRPGGMGAAGTLSFLNGLTESGGVGHEFEFSTTNGANDLIDITGDLTLSNTNTITATHLGGGIIPPGTYTLFNYTGNFNGGLTNLALSGASGLFTNPPNKIQVIIFTPLRPSTNLTWYGDGSANSWDTTSAGDWKNGAVFFAFQAGDPVTFDNSGAANPTVNVPLSVLPASVTVNAANDYTFTGVGNIGGGSTSLVKTNSGLLVIATTNGYTGPTIIGGGVLETINLNNGNTASGIGAASSESSNLVIYGGATLKYSGGSVASDRGATFVGAGSIIDVTNSITLTLNGPLAGTGSMVKAGAGTLAFNNPNNYSGGTVISNGVIALESNAANDSGANNALGPITGPVTFLGGTLQLYGYNGSTSPNYNTFRSPLVVPAGQSGTLRLFSRGPSNSSGLASSLTGSGTLNLVVNYVRDNLDGDWSGFSGLINVTAKPGTTGSELRINNSFGYTNATIYLNNDVIMDRASSANSTINIGALSGDTNAVIGPGNGSSGNTTWSIGWKNINSTYSGHIRNDVITSLTKVGAGTLTFNGGLNIEITTDGFSYFTNLFGSSTNLGYSGPTVISNGVLQLVSPVTLTNTANTNGIPTPITLASATAVLDGLSMGYFVNQFDSDNTTVTNILLFTNGVFELAPNQSLTGIGTILASNVLADAGSVLNPGLPLGTLNISQKIELAGAVNMNVNATGTPNCSAIVASTIQVDGTAVLTVTNLGPEAGATFQLFNHPVSGFASVNLPPLTGTNTWVNNLTSNGSITLLAPPPVPATPPVMTNAYDSASSQLTLSWGAEYKGYYRLLAQTNTTSVGLTSDGWVEWTGSGATNLVVIPVDKTKGTVFFRLVYP
jgi:autotransporter-associated beta strand protein